MSKLYFIIFLCLVLKNNANAQVVLTQKDTVPLQTKIVYSYVRDTSNLNNFKFSKLGMNNFWDFSTLSLNYNDTVKFISPTETPYIVDFIDAQAAIGEVNGLNAIYFHKSDSVGYYEMGSATFMLPCPIFQSLRYKHPHKILQLPAFYPNITYDTNSVRTKFYINQFEDTAYCEESFYSKREIVATGVIKLPFGSFDAFLLKTTINVSDTTWIKGIDGKWRSEINVIKGGDNFRYDWYCNKSLFWVARIVASQFDYIDFIMVQMNNYANLKSLNVEDLSSLKTNIYPNPATEKLFIENNLAQNSSYIITSLLGQEIDKGLLKSEIDISHLLNGVYVLKIVGTNNQTQVLKFIKQ